MKAQPFFTTLGAAGAALLGFVGCSFLKPSGVEPRSFVLTALPAAGAPPGRTATSLGVATVKVPSYLLRNSMAVRRGTNEVAYLEAASWAERLDLGLQRVLAANLATLLPTDRVHLSAWEPSDVSVEVFVTVEQFDVDEKGAGVLTAWWRLVSPVGERELKTGRFHRTQPGPVPRTDPQGATATMSALVADFSRELTEVIKSSGPR